MSTAKTGLRRWAVAISMGLSCATAAATVRTPAYPFIVPPRQAQAREKAVYGRIAQYLKKATGAPITFHYVSNWLTYMADVHANKAALYFDGPSFIGWRIAHYHDHVLVALTGSLTFVVVGSTHDTRIQRVRNLIGRGVCTFSPPNLGTLTLDSRFRNPSRQPFTIPIHSFTQQVRDLIAGKCDAGIQPLPVYLRMAHRFPGKLRIITKLPPLPNQAFSVSAGVPKALRRKITSALLSPGGSAATLPLRAMFGHKTLIRVHNKTYTADAKLLNGMAGF